MVHKLFCDSRARKDGDHASWSWQPERPISVPKSRAFIDSVSLPVAWETVGDNQYLYVTENQTLRKVLAGQGKVYVLEAPHIAPYRYQWDRIREHLSLIHI